MKLKLCKLKNGKVILNLIQNLSMLFHPVGKIPLKLIDSGSKPGMTEQTCHPEALAEGSHNIKRFFAIGARIKRIRSAFILCSRRLRMTETYSLALWERGRERGQKAAFTLAEVLITLGIIGVVAAMTIPTLIANTRSQQYRSKFKKTISTLSQAARMSQAQYGFDYAGITQRCGSNGGSEHPDNTMSVCAILNGTLKGYTYYYKAEDIPMNKNGASVKYSITPGYFINYDPGSRNLSAMQAYVLSDGTIIAISRDMQKNCTLSIGNVLKDAANAGETSNCLGFIDVNGVSLPNKEVSCSSGSDSLNLHTCIVKNDAQHMTDIFPIRFHDGIVEPASAAARYILKTAK